MRIVLGYIFKNCKACTTTQRYISTTKFKNGHNESVLEGFGRKRDILLLVKEIVLKKFKKLTKRGVLIIKKVIFSGKYLNFLSYFELLQ